MVFITAIVSPAVFLHGTPAASPPPRGTVFCPWLVCREVSDWSLSFFFFLAALGLPCSGWASSSCGQRELLFVAALRLLTAWLLLLWIAGFSSCGTQTQQLWRTGLVVRGMWDLPGPGLEPVSPALAGGFLTTAPPGKSLVPVLKKLVS